MKCKDGKEHKWIEDVRISKAFRTCSVCGKTEMRRLNCSTLGGTDWM